MDRRTLGVHSGTFHADEVTAAAFLVLYDLIDLEGIRRTRSLEELTYLEYVCDVGGVYDPLIKRFDHHQASYKGPLSSAGMVLLYLKNQKIISPELFNMFNLSLVLGVDAHDNGVAKIESGTATFSHVISNFMPIRHEASDEELKEAFLEAVVFVMGHLDRLQKRFYYIAECKNLVKNVMKTSKEVLVFNISIPWMDSFFELGGNKHPAKFLIMPTGSHWKLRGIPPTSQEKMKVRFPHPTEWGGLLDHELVAASGIEGGVFCHKGLFISIWETKKAAELALQKILGK